MSYCITEFYKGYEVSGQALQEWEFWRGIVTLEQTAHRPGRVAVTPLCATAREAVERAVKAGEKCVDSDGFTLTPETTFCLLPEVDSDFQWITNAFRP